ncbi:hypothetical protein H6G81_30115 [Scytonema hofmannii FACHB-248]|uniref:Uncharacterized protein n=1 Tax=Scytonema hofmannii FACHB-248 TaxID=1842502 RepID=A0ABR8GYP2_9CYAN|nr:MULTISPECIES: hypothetical protein [Nostocales]MBD2608657.1 hypothetical protein [Scytonema hofmannii FACHB-248]
MLLAWKFISRWFCASSNNNRTKAVDFTEPGRPLKSTCSGAYFRNPSRTLKTSLSSLASRNCSFSGLTVSGLSAIACKSNNKDFLTFLSNLLPTTFVSV